MASITLAIYLYNSNGGHDFMFVQITEVAALKKYVNASPHIYVLKPVGEKGRKALFSLDELFKDCLFLEDVSYDDSNKIKQDILNSGNNDMKEDSIENTPDSSDIDDSSNSDSQSSMKRKGKIDEGTLRALYQAQWSVKDIADEFSTSVSAVYNFIKRKGITR